MDDDEVVVKQAEPAEYGLHIRLTREMQPRLKSSAELAYEMGDIPKPFG